jgi:hypothetical protein
VLRAADVDRSRALRVVLGAVDVRPGSRVENEVCRAQPGRRRRADVPIGERERRELVTGEGLDQRLPELAVRPGD